MSSVLSLFDKVAGAPKAELHVHIEGTLEPELLFKLAQRNGIKLAWSSVEALREAYQFDDLQSFLDIYYAGTQVLLKENDFYEMTCEYVKNALANGIIHCEIFFDPQSHTSRGVGFDVFMPGILRALEEGKNAGLSAKLILCFLRHLSEEDALKTFEAAQPWFECYPKWLIGVGLDSSEVAHPPVKFTRVFSLAKKMGLKCVAHAGEEGPAEYIWQALNVLHSERIDHGVRSIEDPKLMVYLSQQRIPLTVCPLSNVKLKVFNNMKEHNLRELMQAGVKVTINSDDPAYFGGYVNNNYRDVIDALQLSEKECYTLLENSLTSAFLDDLTKEDMLRKLNDYWFSEEPAQNFM
ncbi:TPA: adenosine deaminase [Providencia alcalifaciens]